MRADFQGVPLYFAIVEFLERKKGRARDIDIYNALRERYDISFTTLLKELMKLEMQGIVNVIVLKENERVVELVSSYK